MYALPAGTQITGQIIQDVIAYNEKRRARFDKLANYYIGQHDILDRTKADTLPNNKVMINHAKYIVDTSVGYLLGNSVSYQATDGIDVQPILDSYKRQTIGNLDTEIAKDLAIFGIQYEYVYADENAQPVSAELDNRNTIIVYDTTLQHNKMFAVNYRPVKLAGSSKVDHYDVLVVDKEMIYNYTLTGSELVASSDPQPHAFKAVPVIEYQNNAEYLGDFEPVISLIDAYNIMQSDRVNDRQQLVDAILVAKNFKFNAAQLSDLKQSRLISGLPENATIEYLVKSLNEADTDVLRKNLEADIHKISMVPNMADENFAANSSGVAIRYKLLSFEQATKNKERYFERGLMERFKLYSNFLASTSVISNAVSIEDVDAIFRRNLPSNDFETSQMINNLVGLVDKSLLASQLSFVQDAQETVDLASQEATSTQDPNYGTMTPTNAPQDTQTQDTQTANS